MRYAHVGTSGLEVSRLVLGMMSFGDTSQRAWHVGLDAARPLVRRAAEAGVTAYDTADYYDRGVNEEVTGRLLRELYRAGRTTCCRPRCTTRCRGLPATAACRGATSSPRSTARSGGSAPTTSKAQHVAEGNGWHRFVAMQNHYHLAYREEEREMVPLCLDQGVGVLPYSPLARGLHTGTRTRGGGGATIRSDNDPAATALYSDADFDVVDRLVEVARELGRPPAEVALAWLRDRAGVSAPVVGVTKGPHLEDALESLDLELSREECARPEAAYVPHPVAGPE
ncbi:MAG TPA: aldo/keto reductase [Nocardioides sp.]|jgi:aryl-alcohol dehydrogenase-like predicted oxidoreductase|nr:aldo/keto reductase [Nocardioides sp.]